MSDSCLICQCEPIESFGWFVCADTLEAICPWCVKEMINQPLVNLTVKDLRAWLEGRK